MIDKFKKAETEEQLIICWADSLIFNSDHKGIVSKKSLRNDYYNSDATLTEQEKEEWNKNSSKLIRDEALKKSGILNGNHGVIIQELNRLSSLVKDFLYKNDYITEPRDFEDFLTLTPTGKEVKNHKGHKKYQAFKKRELAAITADQKSKKLHLPIVVAFLGILISAGISLFTFFYNESKNKNASNDIDKLRIQQQNMQLKQQKLESQIDSISILLLSKPKNTSALTK